MSSSKGIRRPAFLYWGRRGPITGLARGLMAAGLADGLECFLSLSQHNALAASFTDLGERLLPVPTFARNHGAVTGLVSMVLGQRRLVEALRTHQVDAVITLMSHVWSPFLAPRMKALGVPYAVIVHDAEGHPGDPTGLVNRWLLRDAGQADTIFTLSRATARRLAETLGADSARIVPLFHPDLRYDGTAPLERQPGEPLRVLFFGRMLPYKGLGLFIEALDVLAGRGVAVNASVVGEGDIAPYRPALERLGVSVDNRWVADAEVSGIFSRHDLVAATHVEASQSGIVATALAHLRPVVVTPVGGLVEQVADGQTGLVAKGVTGVAVAQAIETLAADMDLYEAMVRGIAASAPDRSAQAFLRQMLAALASRAA